MQKEYDTFIMKNEELPDGRECYLAIRDLTAGKRKYQTLFVKALVSSSAEQLPDGDTMWVRTELGRLHKEPWKIKIIEQAKEIPFHGASK